ncbi:PDR/VanB family oxidoreductase [Roseibium aggregatum]|uniref:Oxidoreductase n=1 Tax=Roseibium aggregatum TaxID=187304 RepID=A0A926P6L2_9HYPH|nr:PDR/VanB family oxidoreductase [Roseibium aggregatum]MBD1549611.1 oxidoreductase [Roseibium aggregatum]
MTIESGGIRTTVTRRRELTPDIAEFTLVAADGGALPAFTPGAHITVQTPSDAVRRYSLVGTGEEPDAYVIAVKREPESRGGSRSMHEQVQEGTELLIEPPENDFPLKDVPKYLLIAGGIGITPIYSMAQKLAEDGKAFSIIYCTRSPEQTAYREELQKAFPGKVKLHHDKGDPAKAYDFWDNFAEPQTMHVYCCGPKPLMEEIKAVSGHWPEGRVNFEDFKPVEVVRADDHEFKVELARSGQTVTVPADKSILEALRENGFKTPSSCESGTCGTCKTRLLAGEPDHRDMVLMDEEKADTIMICVSRAKSGDLVLDL